MNDFIKAIADVCKKHGYIPSLRETVYIDHEGLAENSSIPLYEFKKDLPFDQSISAEGLAEEVIELLNKQ